MPSRSLRPLFLSILPSRQTAIQNLRELREQLSHDLTELINDLGPKLYPDFESARIVREVRNSRSRSTSPSPSRPLSASALRLRPLYDWLDDKSFNWEKAEDSDYDDVFFFLDQQNSGRIIGRNNRISGGSSSSVTRSRSSSVNSNVSSNDGLSSNGLGFTKVDTTEKRSTITNIPKVEITDFEDSGYQGDKETTENESKKNV